MYCITWMLINSLTDFFSDKGYIYIEFYIHTFIPDSPKYQAGVILLFFLYHVF